MNPVDDLIRLRERVAAKCRDTGQEHLLERIDTIPANGSKYHYLRTIDEIDLESLKAKFEAAVSAEKHDASKEIVPYTGKVGSASDEALLAKSYRAGIEALGAGSVACVLLAGGQGTRLGHDAPKGTYDIGLPSGASLFQLVLQRIMKLRELAKLHGGTSASIPLYIMTSPMNDEVTKQYMYQHDFFGLPPSDVRFFCQGTLPCVTNEGLVIQESVKSLAFAPDGNGGIYPALLKTWNIDDMEKRGIKHVHIFAIDNALVSPADPAFIGYCINENADVGNKVIKRASPDEKVGMVAETVDGKPVIIEYTEATPAVREASKHASICNHFYTLDFLREKAIPAAEGLYHVARKKIPYWDSRTGKVVQPATSNGIKLESFIFDVFPLSDAMAVWEVSREGDFAPVKNANAEGAADTPDIARRMISERSRAWLAAAGIELFGDTESDLCEILPGTSYGGEGLGEYHGKTVKCPFKM